MGIVSGKIVGVGWWSPRYLFQGKSDGSENVLLNDAFALTEKS